MKALIPFLLALFAWPAGVSALETQNGLQIAVAPKTISRNDTRYAYYFTSRSNNRMMALQIVTKNVSIKPMPEGTLEWQILVLRTGYGYSYSSGSSEHYAGTEKLPALKAAASNEVLVGSAQIGGWNDGSTQRKDKMEYKITVKHDGKVTAEVTSTPAFDSIAAHAHKNTTPKQ